MQCNHEYVKVLYRVGKYATPPEYYCNGCGKKSKEPFGSLFISPTAYTTQLVSEVSLANKNMKNEEFKKNLKRAKKTVDIKKTEAQKLLEELRNKTKSEEEERKQCISNINKTLQEQLENNYKDLDNALATIAKNFENKYNSQLEWAIADRLKNGLTSFEQTTIKLNDTSKKRGKVPKKIINSPTPISKAILLVKTLNFRPTIDSKEIDGIKYFDIGFSQPLDIDSDKLDFFGNNVKIVEWADVPKELFGFKSKIFGTKKDVKTLRITEEELIKRYEHTMGSKIS